MRASAERAVDYWQQAGQRAAARSAMAEAAGHLGRGLEVLASLPEGPARRSKELELQTALGRALIAAKGYAAEETGRAFARARMLAAEMEDGPQLFPVLFGQSLFRLLRGELDVAREVAQEMLGLAERQQDTGEPGGRASRTRHQPVLAGPARRSPARTSIRRSPCSIRRSTRSSPSATPSIRASWGSTSRR